MKENVTGKKKEERKSVTVTCVFPEESLDSDTIKDEIKNILSTELSRQMQRIAQMMSK